MENEIKNVENTVEEAKELAPEVTAYVKDNASGSTLLTAGGLILGGVLLHKYVIQPLWRKHQARQVLKAYEQEREKENFSTEAYEEYEEYEEIDPDNETK